MIITTLFLFFGIVHLLFWLLIFSRLVTATRSANGSAQPKVSIVVVFKNELENLRRLIPLLLAQDYPNFEILLCDDFSSDGSYESAQSYADPLITVITASKDLPGKKFALSEAVKQANGKYILVTDADCLPKNKSWLSSMVKQASGKKIVLGYSPNEVETGLLNKFIRFETFMTALQYFSYALVKMPYMGVGRNMMYDRELFLETDAYASSPKLLSGDDDLFINAVADQNNTAINLDPESFVQTLAEQSWSSFFRQKRRHVSASVAYKLIHKVLLSVYSFSHIGIYLLLLLSFFSGSLGFIFLSFVVIVAIKWIIAAACMRKLGCMDLIKYFPLLDLMMVIYYLVLAPSTLFKTKSW